MIGWRGSLMLRTIGCSGLRSRDYTFLGNYCYEDYF